MARSHPFACLWIVSALVAVAFLACTPRRVEAAVAPEVLFGADNAADNDTTYYICPNDVQSDSVKYTATTTMAVQYVQFYVQSGTSVTNFDLYMDVRLGDSVTSTIWNSYSITSTFSTSMTGYQIDITPDLLWLEAGETVNFTFRMTGAGSCISTTRFTFRGSTADNDEEESMNAYSGSWSTADGPYVLGLGETSFTGWEGYTTSSDPYGYFTPYASSSYAFSDPDFGWFGNAIVDVLKYLFVGPFTAVNDWFQLQLQNARYRWPGGYVVRLQEAWQNSLTDAFSSTSSTTITATIPLPTGDAEGPIFSNTFAQSNGFDLDQFREISVYVFWFLYMWYVFERSLRFFDSMDV